MYIYKHLVSAKKRFKKSGGIIGENCSIHNSVEFGSEPYLITIGDNVRITAKCSFITHDGGVWVIRKLGIDENCDLFGKITIKNNTHIGIGSTIMPGVTIGENCIIGCGSIVTKDIPDNSVAVGVPAKVIETIDQYYEKNKQFLVSTKNLSKKEKHIFLSNNSIFKNHK